MTKQEISDLIYNRLDYMYCDNCRYYTELEDEPCNYCHRKYSGWALSRAEADSIAEAIYTAIKLGCADER